MESFTLGLNFFGGHDTAIFAIFDDDVYGLSEERITRIKHDSLFPLDAIKEMLRYKNIDPILIKNLYVGVATQGFEKRIFNAYAYEMTSALRAMIQEDLGVETLYIKDFVKGKEALLSRGKFHTLRSMLTNKHGRDYLKMQFLGKKMPLDAIIKKHLHAIFPNATLDVTFYEHHLLHATSSYYSSHFEKALAFTFDGEGDGVFSKLYVVDKGEFTPIGESRNIFVPNMQKYDFADSGYASVGNIYAIFTHLLGFTPHADEGKVEALAAFGRHDNRLYDALCQSVKIDETTLSMEIQPDILNTLFEPSNLQAIFTELCRENISAAVQKSTEFIAQSYLLAAKKKSGIDALCLAGGVSANVIMNLGIYENLFEKLFIIPAMGDDGVSQGAAVVKYLEKNPSLKGKFRFPRMPYFGSSYTQTEVLSALKASGEKFSDLGDGAYLEAAKMIVEGKIGALFFGRSEFGPRALGNRSIIADVRNRDIQRIINKEIKNRPLFQPFCPSIMIEEKERLFEKAYDNRHMTTAFRLRREFADQIPGAVHVDMTARVQFVSQKDNPHYHALLSRVKALTGFGVIINTSFNKHGRTMVLSPTHALEDFKDTNLDFMVIEGFLVEK